MMTPHVLRPIGQSVSVVSNIFERILQQLISSYIEKDLSPFLCGYRKGIQHNIGLIEEWKHSIDNHGYSGPVIMDLSKAFDTINHKLLLAKLYAYGFDKQALRLLRCYLSIFKFVGRVA